jgi:predicted phage replisome organizer
MRLLTLAGKMNDRGLIYLDEGMPYSEEMLSSIINRSLQTTRLALSVLQKFDMIRIFEDGNIKITNWEKHQNIEGMERHRELARIRQQRFRERQRLEQNEFKENALCNVTVTKQNKNKNKNKINTLETEQKTTPGPHDPDYVKYWERKAKQRGKGEYSPEFSKWWETYPKPESKKKTFTLWLSLLKNGVSVEDLQKAAENYRRETADRDPQFKKHSTTFLGPSEPYQDYINRENHSAPERLEEILPTFQLVKEADG